MRSAPQIPADDHDDHGGLQRDLPVLLGRRDALRWLGGMSLAGVLAACGVTGRESAGIDTTSASTAPPATQVAEATPGTTLPSATATTAASATTMETPTTVSPGTEIPDETAGPFPADGSNGPNVLAEDGVMKSDLTTSFGAVAGTADGIRAVFQLTVVDAMSGAPVPAAVVYLWHCTADGRYSIYEISDQNYLRGLQTADDAGRVAFTSIFPGCYPGRWPHCHFEVYASLDDATAGGAPTKTSQLAFPQADCEVVYADPRYGASSESLSRLSLDTDNVFRDGWTEQLATVAGSVGQGFTASLLVRV